MTTLMILGDNDLSRIISGVKKTFEIYENAFSELLFNAIKNEGVEKFQNYSSNSNIAALKSLTEKQKKDLLPYLKLKNNSYDIDPEVHVKSIVERLKNTFYETNNNILEIVDSATEYLTGIVDAKEYLGDVKVLLGNSANEYKGNMYKFEFENNLAFKALKKLPEKILLSNPGSYKEPDDISKLSAHSRLL